LYGITPEELENKMYYEALAYKVDAGTELQKELIKKNPPYESDDSRRLFYVEKAIQYTKALINEKEER